MKVVLLVGLPGSGKSTWLAERAFNAISSDEVRRLLTGDAANQSFNARVFRTVRFLLHQRLAIGMETSYIDATNLTRDERKPYFRIARLYGAEVDAVVFNTPLTICKERNLQRTRVVSDEAMEKLAARYEPVSAGEGFSAVTSIATL